MGEKNPENTERILIGRVTSAVGLKGEVKVYSYAESPDRFKKLKTVIVDGGRSGLSERKVIHARMQGHMVVLLLEGAEDRNAAERMRGADIYMREDQLEPPEPGRHYIRDLIGLAVVNDADGRKIGVLRDILTDRPQNIYVVKREKGPDIMIPGVDQFIREISEDRGEIRVTLIEGME